MIYFAVSLKQMFLSFSDPPSLEGMEAEQKSKKTRRVFGTQPKKTWPRPDGPNASGWYWRLWVSLLSVYNSVQP